MGHPVALEPLLPFIFIFIFIFIFFIFCALLIGISNNDPFLLPDMAVLIEDKKETKRQEMGWNEARPTDEGVLSCKLLGQVNFKVEEGTHTACYLKAVESKSEA